MKRITLFFLILLPFVIFSCGKSDDDTPPVDPPNDDWIFEVTAGERPTDLNPDDWVLDKDMSDQFNAANVSGKWNDDPNDFGPWSWEEDNVYNEDGILNLRMRYEEHSARDMDMFYKSGMIRSLDTLTYGYVEARIQGIPVYPAASPALWLYSIGSELEEWGYKKDEEGSTHYAEVDIVEMLQGEWDPSTPDTGPFEGRLPPEVMDCNLHTIVYENGQEVSKRPGSHPELTENIYVAPWDPREDYHTYGAEMTPEKITWYVDGIKVAEKENLHWHVPMHVTLSLGLRYPHVTYNSCPNNLWRCPVASAATQEGFPTNMKVDWVRTYRKR